MKHKTAKTSLQGIYPAGNGNRKKCFNILAFLAFIFSLSTLIAREAPPATGGEATGSRGSVSHSIGQIVYSIHTGTNGSIVEGIQQLYEISVVIGINEAHDIRLELSVYPNPTSGFLTM